MESLGTKRLESRARGPRLNTHPLSTKFWKSGFSPGGIANVFDQKGNADDHGPPVDSPVQSTKAEDRHLKSRRAFRRLRWQFKQDLGLGTLTRADRVLIDQCALLALRTRQMRDAILTGEAISDEDLVRTTNACIRGMAAIERRKDRTINAAKPQTFEERMQALEQTPRKEFNEDDF
jgi:hypothetical protein